MRKKPKPSDFDDEMRPEYDFSKMKFVGRGIYSEHYRSGTNLVLLDSDVRKAFPNDESVNEALRVIAKAAKHLAVGPAKASRRNRKYESSNDDNCYEIKMIGDSFMIAFRTAIEALDFALAFHADTGAEMVRSRAGIHVGPARVFENDLFGMMVNYTKRVESIGNPELIVVSSEAKNHIDYEKASRHSRLDFLGREVTFKGFEAQQRVWRVWYPEMMKLLAAKKHKAMEIIGKSSPVRQAVAKVLLGK